MKNASTPFALPSTMESRLASVFAYWQSLKRGEANMPFWDDVKLSALPALAGNLMLVDAFAKPERYRFGACGASITEWYGSNVVEKFADEIDARGPLRYIRSQCSATVEGAAPTYYGNDGYARALLPMWGDGHISMLLGAIVKAG